MTQLALTLLGGFNLSADGGPVALPTRKAAALLAYLALRPDERHAREKLATLLWGRQTDEQARRNLRHCLGSLRKAMGASAAAVIDAGQDSIMLRAEAIEIDVGTLRHLVDGGLTKGLADAVGLCKGEFLADMSLREEGFDDWLDLERETARKLQADVLRRFAEDRLAQGDGAAAVAATEKLTNLDPLDESAQRLLMHIYAAAGRRSAALAHYQTSKALLKRELDIAPEAETTALVAAIKASGDGDGPIGETAPNAPAAPLTLPDRPSIAVLPFDNMSGDPEQDYFADGLSEDLITALSSVPWIFVIARNSSFTYKGLSVDVRKIGNELGVRYILEGSVRRSGDRLRVSGQLIDTESGKHIWANRFDGVLEDVFKLQDQITQAVVGTIAPKIKGAEIERVLRKRPDNLNAYDYYLKALAALNKIQISDASTLLEKSIAMSSGYPIAKAVRAWCYTLYGWDNVLPIEKNRITAIRLAAEALSSPNADAETSAYAGYTIAFMTEDIDRGIALVEDATDQCPSFAWAWASLALLEFYFRSPERAIGLAKTSQRLNPRDPHSFRCDMAISGAYLKLDRLEECLNVAARALQKNPDIQFFIWLQIACLVQLERLDQAQAVADRFLVRVPEFRLSEWLELDHTRTLGEDLIALIDSALRRVGVPE